MGKYCIVCRMHYAKENEKRRFYKFPSNQASKEKWCNSLALDVEAVKRSHLVCSDHFSESDFVTRPGGRKDLKGGATPAFASTSRLHIYPEHDEDDKDNFDVSAPKRAKLSESEYASTSMTKSRVWCAPANEDIMVSSNEEPLVESVSGSITTTFQQTLQPSPKTSKSPELDTSSEKKSVIAIQLARSSSITSSSSSNPRERRKRKYQQIVGAVVPQKKFRGKRYFGDCTTSDMDNPARAHVSWKIAKKTVSQQRRKIKNLQASVRFYRKRVNSLRTLVKHLKTKFAITESAESVITAAVPGSSGEIIKRFLKGPSTQKFTPDLRSFALTLHFYSPKAYEYVRAKFNNSLPHPITIAKWYKSIDGSPGVSQEALQCVRDMAQEYASTGKQLVCNLVLDEMAIRRHCEWTGKQFKGYVNIGVNIDSDALPEAKDALVFMLVALNGHWKITVAYYFTDGLNGPEKSNITLQLLQLIDETGAIVSSITFDGAPSNINMAKYLGAEFDNIHSLRPYFQDPASGRTVMILFDMCHMLKLVRNCLASKGSIKDGDDNLIEWRYLEKLCEIQDAEGLQLGTKFKKRHVQWFREKMKVKVAAQTFSNSVADALMYLARDMKIDFFETAEPTASFCKRINNLFDIFNSHSLYSQMPFKKAITPQNVNSIFKYLDECKSYIHNLKIDNIPFYMTQRKTGFIGLLVCIESLKLLYEEFVENNILKFITTYKLSQDHLEIYFSAVRSKGGCNNNPTARQFESILKKLLVHTEIKGKETANAVSIDSTKILCCSSSTRTNCGAELQESEEFQQLVSDISNIDFVNSPAWHLTSLVSDVVGYIAGFVVRSLKNFITCEFCQSLLEDEECHSLLQVRKTFGKLIKASKFVIDICRICEKMLRVFMLNTNMFSKKNFLDILIIKVKRNLPRNVVDALGDHIAEMGPLDSHCMDMITVICKKYLTVRIHHETKKITATEYKVRSVLTKQVLFSHQ